MSTPGPSTWAEARARLAAMTRRPLGEDQAFLLLAIYVGVFAGLAVVCFRIAIEWVRIALLGSGLRPSPLRTVLVPTLTGLLIGLLVNRFFAGARGSGVNQTKAAVYIYDGYIPFRTVVGKFLTCTFSIGGGHSLGPEDPSLQIGAGLAALLGRGLNLSRERIRLIAPLGAAAGLAAAFNAPIAAVLFVIEEVIGRWSSGVLGAVVLSAVSSVVVAHWFLGADPLFRLPAMAPVQPGELPAYAALGILGGLVAAAFLRLVLHFRPRLQAQPARWRSLQPAVAGLAIGVIGLWFPGVMGAGYETVDQAIHGQYVWQTLALLTLFKLVATALSFVSGTPGGLFAPTLFMGAVLGGAVGELQRSYFPEATGPSGMYALVGMGTLFAGILRAPMTSVFMILEVTGSYGIIVPVMISNTLAYLVSRQAQRVPIFDALTRQEGVDLPSMEEERERAPLRVEDAMRPWSEAVVQAGETVDSALRKLRSTPAPAWVLVDTGRGTWKATARETLEKVARDSGGETPVAQADGPTLAVLHPDHSLELALQLIHGRPLLPVVHRANARQLIGVVSLDDVLGAYRRTALGPPPASGDPGAPI